MLPPRPIPRHSRWQFDFPPKLLHAALAMWLFSLSILIAIVVPPFQSPDEFDHLTRAYLFSKGQIVLIASDGKASGGFIDTGLARYMDAYSNLPFQPAQKLNSENIALAKQITWTGLTEFRSAPGMAYYFPAIYLIHGLGLRAGETIGLSVADSYYLTRIILLITICIIIFYAFCLVPPNYLTVALLLMPMSLFQFASASLDGIATALSILLISIYLKCRQDRSTFNTKLLVLGLLIWTLLAASRLQTFPMALLLLAEGWAHRRYKYLLMLMVSALGIIGWQLLTLSTTVDGRVALGATSQQIIYYYVTQPDELFAVFWRTLTNNEVLKGYFSSFIGLLGWLDTPFPGSEYKYMFFALLTIAVISVNASELKKYWPTRLLMLSSAAGMLFIVFFSVLVTWTPHPAAVIEGVVGRYFLIPGILIAYALTAIYPAQSTFKQNGCIWLSVWLFGTVTTAITLNLLLYRYFL